MFALLIAESLRGMGPPTASAAGREILILGESARAAAVAWIVALSVSGGSADPGMVFFICLATVVSCRQRLSSAVTSPVNLHQRAH